MLRLKPITFAVAALLASGTALADAPLGPPLLIDEPALPGPGVYSVVARAPDGQFIVIGDQDQALLVRRFAADGVPLGASFRLGGLGGYRAYDIAIDGEGGAVIAWLQYESGSRSQRLMVRRYGADGSALGEPTVVEAGDADTDYGAPAVAVDADGDFIVGWATARSGDPLHLFGPGVVRFNRRPGERQVQLRRYDRNGVALGAADVVARRRDLQLDTSLIVVPGVGPTVGAVLEGRLLDTVDVAMDADGDHVVVWADDGGAVAYAAFDLPIPYPAPGAWTSRILARRYDARGVALQTSPIRVDTAVRLQAADALPVGVRNSVPQVAMQPNGDHAIGWVRRETIGDRETEQLQIQRYTAAGRRLPRQALGLSNRPFSDAVRPIALATAGPGSYVLAWPGLTWARDGEQWRTVGLLDAVRLEASGTLGTPFRVAGDPQGVSVEAVTPTVAADARGATVFTFLGREAGATVRASYARLFEGPSPTAR